MNNQDIERLSRISEGNPGALTVITQLARTMGENDLALLIDEIEKHELFGPKLWVAYRDHCHDSVDQLSTAIFAHSPGLQATLRTAGFPEFTWK